MSLGSWLSNEFKLAEIALLNTAAKYLNQALPQLEGLVAADAPQTIGTAVATIESADGKILGPIASTLLNAALTAYESDLAPELEAIVASGGGSLIANVITAMGALSSKLELEVNPPAIVTAVEAPVEPASEPVVAAAEEIPAKVEEASEPVVAPVEADVTKVAEATE